MGYKIIDKIKTLSLNKHSQLFAVSDSSRDCFFVQAISHPYLEEPYRAESYAIAYVKEGSINLQVGLTKYFIQAPAIISLSPLMIRSFHKSMEAMKMDIVFFKDSFLLEGHPNRHFLTEYNFFENSELKVIPLTDDLLFKVKTIFELLNLSQSSSVLHLTGISRNYIMLLIYEMDIYQRSNVTYRNKLDQIYPLFASFKKLLAKNYMNERKLDFYASHLHVTPKYLSAIIKKNTGKSAAQWISESITLEAKVLLQNLELTVSQISNELTFSDQSTFGKFFRANTGLTPIQYRKGLS